MAGENTGQLTQGPRHGLRRRCRRASPRSLSPAPFAFDHPPQSLTARRAAEPLAGAATGDVRSHSSQPGRSQQKNSDFACWALTLAGLRVDTCRRIPTSREGAASGLRRPAGVRRSDIDTAGFGPGVSRRPSGVWRYCRLARLSSPSPSCSPALEATVSSLGVGGSKRLLASFEQTRSLTRPTSPLTGTRLAASWSWAQGSCELPTAKPRMRSP